MQAARSQFPPMVDGTVPGQGRKQALLPQKSPETVVYGSMHGRPRMPAHETDAAGSGHHSSPASRAEQWHQAAPEQKGHHLNGLSGQQTGGQAGPQQRHDLPGAPDGRGGPDGMAFVAGKRHVHAFHRANRHSGRVRFLRIALPVTGAVVVVALIAAYAFSGLGGGEISIASTGFRDGRMVMKNPELNGVDASQRPFSLSATEAAQDPARPGRIELTGIDATVPMEGNVFARIIAGNGLYDVGAKTLSLGETVDVETGDGMSIRLQDAEVDMGRGLLQTGNPVMMKTRQAEVSADTLSVEDNGERIVLDGRVRMTIYPAEAGQVAGGAQ